MGKRRMGPQMLPCEGAQGARLLQRYRQGLEGWIPSLWLLLSLAKTLLTGTLEGSFSLERVES